MKLPPARLKSGQKASLLGISTPEKIELLARFGGKKAGEVKGSNLGEFRRGMWLVHDLMVIPEIRGQGLGKLLLAKTVDVLREKEAKSIHIVTRNLRTFHIVEGLLDEVHYFRKDPTDKVNPEDGLAMIDRDTALSGLKRAHSEQFPAEPNCSDLLNHSETVLEARI